jgi:hypothetical protein
LLRVYLSLLAVALAYPVGILLFADQWAFGGAMVTATFTVGVAALLAVPLVAWCLRRGWLSLWHAGLGGALSGLLCSSVFWYGGVAEVVKTAAPFIAVGAVHGLVFWALALWRNPHIRPGATNAA